MKELIENIGVHADALMKVPANEQNIGSTQAVISCALKDIQRCLQEIRIEMMNLGSTDI